MRDILRKLRGDIWSPSFSILYDIPSHDHIGSASRGSIEGRGTGLSSDLGTLLIVANSVSFPSTSTIATKPSAMQDKTQIGG
ncbi:hypothetical protein EON65_24150 [archaeon]|nr:MAG: hypothetical protein EON65_24150 [archaeon]